MTEIRRAERRHVPAMAALERSCFSLPRTEEMFSRWVWAEDRVILCALEGETLAGYADFQYVLDEGYIGNVAVGEEFRRRGLGRALVQALLREAERRSLSFLTLEVRRSNTAARALYAACGFAAVGEQKKHYEKPTEDAILMTAYLTKEA